MKDDYTVQASLLPFSKVFKTIDVKDCKTLQDIVDKTIPYNFQDCMLIVTLNNQVIQPDEWKCISVKEKDIVGLNFIPRGGGGGRKSGWQIVLQITVAVVVGYLTLGAGAAYMAGAYGTALGYTAAAVGVSMIGAMIMASLASVPKQSKNAREDRSYTISGASNEIDKYGVVPINLGTNRMFPKQAALPYIEIVGKDQYSRQIFTYGYGKVIITDMKLGETNIDEYQDVELEHKFEGDLNSGLKLYSNDVYQESMNVLLKESDGWVKRTTQRDVDECEVDIAFQGLCRYNDNGKRQNQTVRFEIQYAPTNTENWTVGEGGIEVTGKTITEDLSNKVKKFRGPIGEEYYKIGDSFLILDLYSTSIYFTTNYRHPQGAPVLPKLDDSKVILGWINNQTKEWVDNRASLVGTAIQSINDFIVTMTVNENKATVNIGDGQVLSVIDNLVVTDATAVQFVKYKRLVFPAKGQYDVRIRRVTPDTDSDRILDKAYLSALTSVKYTNPVKFANISGTAMRIKATEQLNGSVDSFNVVVSTLLKGYNPTTQMWEDDKVSSNPADLFRYVLQSPAFAKSLPDDKIDLEKLEEWWVYCDTIGLTYDRIIDYEASVDDVLNDICAAGVASISKLNNIYSVIIDNERDVIKGLVTPRNSWDYKGSINYPEIPHGLRIEFRNADRGYETDERIVYADGYSEETATLYERLEFNSCTGAKLAYWYGRRYYATALLQPETHTFKMDFENMTFNRGDRISLVNDVILVGVGQGRIKSLLVDNADNPTSVTGFIIDDVIEIPNTNKFGVRIRDNNGKQGIKYYYLETVEGRTSEFTFKEAIVYDKAPAVGSLCAFVEDGKELDLIVTGIKNGTNNTATITAINYAPARFNPIGEIPPFESNITIQSDFYKPKAPILRGEVQTDESVMIRNSDGSLTSVAVIPLINNNENNINPIIFVRRRGSTEWYSPTILKREPDEIIISGLDDGEYYDFSIKYQRQTGLQLLSDALLIENIKFIGGSTPPKKVQNFRVTVTNGLALFEWAPNDDIDISHYIIKYTSNEESPTWEGAQVAMDKITSTSITNIIHKGVYMIKAVDMLGYESEEATVIFSSETGAFKNVVEEFIEDPEWLGVKENVINQSGLLALDSDNPDNIEGYYYFNPDTLDLGKIYEVSLTANIQAVVTKRDKVRDIDLIRNVVSIRNYGSSSVENADWAVRLEMNLSQDGINWSGWQNFVASQMRFRAVKFRLYLYCSNPYMNVRVSTCRVVVDMPDRYETGENIEIVDANAGKVVQYENPFWAIPSLNITLQDGDVADKIEFYDKTKNGFTIKVYNGSIQGYVKRSFDFIAAGYGRVINGANQG